MFKLLRFMKPYRFMVVLVFILVFLQTLSELLLPTLMAHIVDRGVVAENIPYIWRTGGMMLLVAAGGVVFSAGASYFASVASSGFGKRLRNKVFSHVQHFSLQEFDRVGTASLITRTTNDITQVQQVLLMMMRMMVMAPMMCIGGIIMAVSMDAQLSLVLVVVLPVLILSILLIVWKGIPLFKAMQVKLDKLNLVMREGLTGIRVIRSFNRTEHEKQRFDGANWDLTHTAIKVNQLMAFMMPIMMLVINLSTIAIIWYGGLRIEQGELQVGALMAFIQYAMQILFSLMMLSMLFVMIPRAAASATRINEVLDLQPTVLEPTAPVAANRKFGEIEFRNVSFYYPGAESPALSNISFRTGPGEMTAIIGGTGSGKSTLLHLLQRFYDVDEGKVLVAGVDVREQEQAELRAKMGYVPQTAVIFTGTIADNIRYGKEDASDEELRHAANIAQAEEFIVGMEDQFDGKVTQGGTNLSGGQKQRLAIARALVRKPEVYLFDDSFSALDFKTDAKLRAALRAETEHAAVLIVAQRVSTVMNADQIVVLEDGRIASIGTHHELLQSSKVYQEIVASQLAEDEQASTVDSPASPEEVGKG